MLQGDTDRAYDLLSAPVVGHFAQPDRFLRALLAGQLKHTVWLRVGGPTPVFLSEPATIGQSWHVRLCQLR
jgi:hypothetical protein